MPQFCHLHCHTQYSLLDGAANVASLISRAKILGMKALAITDHGNMFGVPHFVAEARKQGIKPIIGCEFYVAPDLFDHKDKTRYHQLLLAKNKEGYQNLIKLCSLGYTQGHYYKPRIDKAHIKKYAKGLIATTCCLAGEVPKTIITQGEAAGEKVFLLWLEIFGNDYYIELQRHGIPEQDTCNEILCRWGKKYGVKVIATNDVHYVEQKDSKAQDILLCIQTGSDYNDPKRMRFTSDNFFLKSPQQMQELFKDIPEAIINTVAIADQVQTPILERDLLLPVFSLPKNFASQDGYLLHLTLEGATRLYGSINNHLQERINYELGVITSMGYAGYFLIVQDLINAAKKLGVMVGPGRGSVAGSVVAYCLGITNVDPLHYKLIFERFLNPDRISMPDIDIDFDDEGRQKVIAYLVEKYGRKQVAQIITFGSMGARSAIRDVARVLDLPLAKADYLAKLVPEQPGTTLAGAFAEVPELDRLQKDPTTPESKVLAAAKSLEGCVRHVGMHAAGIIIAPDDLTKYIPVKTDKKADLLVTQYDGSVVEKVGMLKMDLLGLKTLSIIKDALTLIKTNHNKDIDIHNLPLDDKKTFTLFQQGATIGIFQFESEGMRKWLAKLKPTHIEDLIAMNSLYRPGPMQFIPNFIARKHGKEKISYPHELLSEILTPTYGIMVYQEQIMKAAQIIGDYTLAEADILRYIMSKKKVKEMEKQRIKFIEGAQKKKNISKEKAKEIFDMMENFSRYGFNRSHSVCYALIAYQAAYLKAHYPAEFMASVLTHNQDDIDKISFFTKECKQIGIEVLGPDINESGVHFSPTADRIRFGLAAIKGVGKAAVGLLIKERNQHGPFTDIYNFCERIAEKKINKKMIERLANTGAFDTFKTYHRKQYIDNPEKGRNAIELLLKYGQKLHVAQNSRQQSLFMAEPQMRYGKPPVLPECEPYTTLEVLYMEKELIGFYISGHPLASYNREIKNFCNANTQNILHFKKKTISLAGVVTDYTKRQSKNGNFYASFTIEDYQGTLNFMLFGENFRKHEHLLHKREFLYITGTVQTRYNQKDRWELRIKTIELLSEIQERYTKKVQITLQTTSITQEIIKKLKKAIEQYPGRCQLEFLLTETNNKMQVPCFARRYQIKPTNNFFKALDTLPGVSYTLQRN